MTARDAATFTWIRSRLAMTRHLGSPPRFGSAEWHRLPDQDPRKHAAVLVAALAWFNDQRPEVIAQQLADELAVHAQLERRAFERVAHDVRRRVNSPTWEQIRRRWAS